MTRSEAPVGDEVRRGTGDREAVIEHRPDERRDDTSAMLLRGLQARDHRNGAT